MPPIWMCCTKDGNTCEKKETCARYIEKDETSVTLWKNACNVENRYILYIEAEIKDNTESTEDNKSE